LLNLRIPNICCAFAPETFSLKSWTHVFLRQPKLAVSDLLAPDASFYWNIPTPDYQADVDLASHPGYYKQYSAINYKCKNTVSAFLKRDYSDKAKRTNIINNSTLVIISIIGASTVKIIKVL